ncbi:MAG: hypothetical protein ACE5I7_10230 [Candidatus Binatia bacterium]
MRTLVVSDTTLSATFRRLSRLLANGAAGQDVEEAAQDPRSDAPAEGGAQPGPVFPPSNRACAEVLWADQAPADQFGETNTLVQTVVDGRRFLVRIAGAEMLAPGTEVLIEDLPGWGTLFEGTLCRSGTGLPLIVCGPPLL